MGDLEEDHYESAVFGCFWSFLAIVLGVAAIVGGLIWWAMA